jgi:predicted metalloendopeptidase
LRRYKQWIDYSALALDPAAPYYSNVLAAKKFEFALSLKRMNAPVDRGMWFMAPQQVNAYYHPMLNEAGRLLTTTYICRTGLVLTRRGIKLG